MTLTEVVEAFAKDLDRQVRMKLNVMEEEAQNQLVDPFKLHSDNM